MQKKSKRGRFHLLSSFLDPTTPIHRSVLTLSQSPQYGKHTLWCSLEPSRHLPFLGFLPKHRLSSKSCNRRLEWLSLLPEVTLQIRVGWLSPADQFTQLSIAMSKGLRGYIFSLGNNLLGRLLFIIELATYLIWIGFFCFSSHGIFRKTN